MKIAIKISALGLIFSVLLASLLIGALWWWIPTPEQIKGCIVTKMFQVELCPGSKDYVSLKKISPYMQKTVVLTEDSGFYQHHGFEWGVIEKNAREGWETGTFKKGGSTLTQQLAKNMFLSKDRTFFRKGLEAIVTYRIEKILTKPEILERYLNVVEFGQNIYGVKKAASFYFKKSPAELSVVESAFLAMLLPNPIKYSSSYKQQDLTKFARKRIDRIIRDMYQYQRINADEYGVAVNDLSHFLSPAPPPNSSDEGYENSSIENELNDSMFGNDSPEDSGSINEVPTENTPAQDPLDGANE
jgi:monofunctional biosynthetic peptidoglycan transglycosylase